MEQWLNLLTQIAKPVLTTLVYTGTNSWLDALQEEIKDRQKNKVKLMLDGFSLREEICEGELELSSERTISQSSLLTLTEQAQTTETNLVKIGHNPESCPLQLSANQLVNNSGHHHNKTLKILLISPQKDLLEFRHLNLENSALEKIVSQEVREFLKENYPLHDCLKAAEFVGGAWQENDFSGKASVKALFATLQAEPTLIVETEIAGSQIIIRLAYWGGGSQRYNYETIFKFNYQKFLVDSVKARVLTWKTTRNKLLELGKSSEDLQRLGGDREINLAIIEEIEALQAAGIDTEDLNFSYHFNEQDFESLCQFLSICNCLVAGWIADIHYLIYNDISPHLPLWLPSLTEAITAPECRQALVSATVSLYRDILVGWGSEFHYRMPELSLKLAQSLTQLPDPSLAIEQVEYSWQCWLQQHQISSAEDLKKIPLSLTPRDRDYLTNLETCLSAWENEPRVAQVRELVQAIASRMPLAIAPGAPSLNVPRLGESPNFQLHHSVTTVTAKVFSLGLDGGAYKLVTQKESSTLELWHFDRQNQLSPTHKLVGHSGKVVAVTLSADGKLLASSDFNQQRSQIKIWNLETGKIQQTLFGHKQPIRALAINLNQGAFLASGSRKIKLWNLQTGESCLTLFGHQEWVNCLAISADGRNLISGSQDKTVRIWNLQTGELHRTLRGHHNAVKAVALTPDGEYLVSGSEDHNIKLWEVKTGKLLRQFSGHTSSIQTLTISPNGEHLLSGSADGAVKIWDLHAGTLLQTLGGHQKAVQAIALSPDGQVIASGCEAGTLQFWRSW